MDASSVIERLRNSININNNNDQQSHEGTTGSNNNKNTCMKKLKLSYYVPPLDDDRHVEELIELLPLNNTITHVVFDRRFVHALSQHNYHRIIQHAIGGPMPALQKLEFWNVQVPLQLLCRTLQQSTFGLQELVLGFVGLYDLHPNNNNNNNCATYYIQQHPSLSKVYISEFRLAEEDNNLDSFLTGLSTCPQLQALELFSSRTAGPGLWSSPQAIAQLFHSRSLQTLTLRRVQLTTAHMTALSNALRECSSTEEYSLRVLDLSENHIGDHAATLLAQSVATHAQLRALNLRDCSITAVGCRGIAQALMQNRTAIGAADDDDDEDRDANDNDHNVDADARNEGDTPTTTTTRTGVLEKLNLASNDIGNPGARALAELLHHQQQHPTLQSLELTSAKIQDDGCIALAHALQQNTTLLSLGLAYNKMTTASYLAFAHALRTNRTLQSIHLQANRTHIGLKGCQALVDMLKDNYVLTSLSTLLGDALDTDRNAYRKMIATYLRLNSAGRKHLLMGNPTKLDWVNALIKCQDDFNAFFYLIKAQPSICEVKK